VAAVGFFFRCANEPSARVWRARVLCVCVCVTEEGTTDIRDTYTHDTHEWFRTRRYAGQGSPNCGPRQSVDERVRPLAFAILNVRFEKTKSL